MVEIEQYPQYPKKQNALDVGPYFIWQEEDGCIIRLIKDYGELHWDFEEMGFAPAVGRLPYTYKDQILTVNHWLELFGWSVAEPIRRITDV